MQKRSGRQVWIEDQTRGKPEGRDSPLTQEEFERIKVECSLAYQPPYTVQEIKQMFPGLYFPVTH